jgi:hypothetical protein
MEYLLKLNNGETRRVKILKTPLYACKSEDVGETVYKTKKQVEESKGRFTFIEPMEAHFLYDEFQGIMVDEGVMLSIWRSLRNPIVKLILKK